jgi:uncharacterized protein
VDVFNERNFDPARCVIDHNNEETIRGVRDRGYWRGLAIYPQTKMGGERMAVLVESCGPLIVNSACDWGVSDPLPVAKTARLMAQRGVAAEAIRKVAYANALAVYGLNGEMCKEHCSRPHRSINARSAKATRCCAAARYHELSSLDDPWRSCGSRDRLDGAAWYFLAA